MPIDSDLELLQGVRLALEGQMAGAVAAFERSRQLDPEALMPALNLLDAYRDAGRMAEADALAEEMLRKWPGDGGVHLGVARLRLKQGRVEDALRHVRDPSVDQGVNAFAFPLLLRLLLAAGRHDEVLREVERAGEDTFWRMDVRLARAFAHLLKGERDAALRALEGADIAAFGALVSSWAEALRPRGALDGVKRALAEALAAAPGHIPLRQLHDRLAEVPSNG